VESNFGNAVASLPQSGNLLEDRRGENNKVSRGVYEAVETKAGKVRIVEAKGRRG